MGSHFSDKVDIGVDVMMGMLKSTAENLTSNKIEILKARNDSDNNLFIYFDSGENPSDGFGEY